MGSLLSVPETAEQLGVNRQKVLAFITDGRLPAIRVGRDWRVSIVDVTRFLQTQRRPGRPLDPAGAWALLLSAEATGRVVVRASAADRDAFWLVNLVRRRAGVRRLHALGRLVADIGTELVAGGEPAGRRHGFAPRDGHRFCDGYIARSAADSLIGRYALADAVGDEINVLLRMVDDDVWPFPSATTTVGPLVAAVDMLADPIDDRSVESARPTVERYL